MLDAQMMNEYDPNMKAIVIGKPILQAFLRTRLRRLGFPNPYDYLAHLIFARKSGQDIAAIYDNWDNNTDLEIMADPIKQNEMQIARDELLTIFNNFLNCCPLTSFLIHTDVIQIDELPDGLVVYYTPDPDQVESTFSGNLPWGYVPGTLMGR